MKRGFRIVPVRSGDAGSIYTIQFQGENETEFDKFLINKEIAKEQDSLARLVAKLESMSDDYGFESELFKEEEGSRWDYVVAIPEGKLRLYCLRIENVLLVVGNGGVKTTRTYQQDAHLYASVEDLQVVHKVLMSRIYSGKLHVDRHTGSLRGLLNFFNDRK